ncbi:shikimate kinase [Streptomyces sp. NPDC059743]|uniref:shikimate kinase n=1 Tax=Streptomyces sp. NPDC059743 TaxID=3346928 RepID=UPI0036593C6E
MNIVERAAAGRPVNGPRIVLVGPMGVGKSTVGALLARQLRCGFRDTDDDIVAAQGRPIRDIFITEGEPRFREIEKRAVRFALAEHDGVLALGGGAVLDASTRALLIPYPVVHLDMDGEEAVRRAGLNTGRPLLAADSGPRRRWHELMEARRPLYAEVARATVATDGLGPDEVAQVVLRTLELTDV